jgi:tellurite resistance protein
MAQTADLTPAERQQILRRLKHGPALDRETLAEYANKLKEMVLSNRKKVQK